VHRQKFLPVKILNNTYHQGNCLMHQGEKIYVLLLISAKVITRTHYAFKKALSLNENFKMTTREKGLTKKIEG